MIVLQKVSSSKFLTIIDMKKASMFPQCDHCPVFRETLFRNCPANVVEDNIKEKAYYTVPRGKLLFMEGEIACGVYCISSGFFKLRKKGEKGRIHTFDLAKAGSLLGTHGIMSRDSRFSVTAVALKNSHVCFLPKVSFLRLIHKFPDFSFQMMDHLCSQIKYMENRTENIYKMSHEQRFAGTLYLLAKRLGWKEQDILDFNLPKKDLAELSGVGEKTISRIIGKIRENGKFRNMAKETGILDWDWFRFCCL